MAFSRYERAPILSFGASFGTSRAHAVIRSAIRDGKLPYREFILHEAERLDHYAGRHYGDSTFWWVIAAASDIGWGLQVPPGTVLRVPDLEKVAALVG